MSRKLYDPCRIFPVPPRRASLAALSLGSAVTPQRSRSALSQLVSLSRALAQPRSLSAALSLCRALAPPHSCSAAPSLGQTLTVVSQQVSPPQAFSFPQSPCNRIDQPPQYGLGIGSSPRHQPGSPFNPSESSLILLRTHPHRSASTQHRGLPPGHEGGSGGSDRFFCEFFLEKQSGELHFLKFHFFRLFP